LTGVWRKKKKKKKKNEGLPEPPWGLSLTSRFIQHHLGAFLITININHKNKNPDNSLAMAHQLPIPGPLKASKDTMLSRVTLDHDNVSGIFLDEPPLQANRSKPK
jgi:hypothetical protein